MKKIIGIIPSTLGFDSNNPFDDKYYVQDTYLEKLKQFECIPIIIPPTNLNINYDALKICDAFLIIGGKKVYEYHFQVIEYALKTNKKLLGICLGMQAIAMYSNNDLEEKTLYKIDNHYFDNITHNNKELLVHDIDISEYSLLSNILGDKLKVNSIHNYAVSKVSHPFKVVATHKNAIEAIEYKNIIGVQFHPELMNNADELFNWLINN